MWLNLHRETVRASAAISMGINVAMGGELKPAFFANFTDNEECAEIAAHRRARAVKRETNV